MRQMYTLVRVCQRVDGKGAGWHSNRMSILSPILIANWKMHGDAARVKGWILTVQAALKAAPLPVLCVFCPPVMYLTIARAALSGASTLMLGGQNCHHEKNGAFTGEMSADMVRDAGANYVIVGHSERRALGETDAVVFAKAQMAIVAGLVPIICGGESRAAYDR